MMIAQEKPGDWAGYGRYAEANDTAARGAAAVFMGNSITEGWAAASAEFFAQNNYIGRGISGQVTSQMLARFRADVIELEPQSVVILAGTNDIAGNNGHISLKNIYGNIVSMAELAQRNGIRPIICSVLPVSEYPWSPGLEPAGKIIALNAMLRDYASKNDCIYVDFHTPMRNEIDGLKQEYTTDNVHVTLQGYRVMEALVKKAIARAIRK